MANIKITDLPELSETPNDANLLEIVDKASETPTSKKITWANIKAAVLTAVGKVNEAVGFTLSGGTTSKTLTVEDTMTLKGYATAAEITTGTEPAKAIAPDQLKLSSPTFANITDSGLTASQTLFSDANKKLITKSAADTMIALVGSLTANNKCFVNAAGNGTEWAAGYKLISKTFDMSTATGSFSITGTGFKPSAMVIIGVIGATKIWSVGLTALDVAYHIGMIYDGTMSGNTSLSRLITALGTMQELALYSYNSDGITVSNTKTGTATGTAYLYFLCFR